MFLRARSLSLYLCAHKCKFKCYSWEKFVEGADPTPVSRIPVFKYLYFHSMHATHRTLLEKITAAPAAGSTLKNAVNSS